MIIRGYHAVTRKQVVKSQKTKGLFLIYEEEMIRMVKSKLLVVINLGNLPLNLRP